MCMLEEYLERQGHGGTVVWEEYEAAVIFQKCTDNQVADLSGSYSSEYRFKGYFREMSKCSFACTLKAREKEEIEIRLGSHVHGLVSCYNDVKHTILVYTVLGRGVICFVFLP